MTRFQPLFRALLGASLSAFLCACAGSGSREGSGSEVLVTLHNFKTGERFELANESHTDRVTYYSDPRHDAARKVQTDEVMSAFVRELERQGLEGHAQPGRAPSAIGSDVIRWGLELEDGGKSEHWLVGTGSAAADWKEFQACRDLFLELYNATVSFQTVENKSGKQYFDDQARAAASQKQGRK